MPPEFPPRPSKRAAAALAVVALVTFLYSIIITAQILLWLVLVGVAVGLYLTYLLIVAVFRLVAAVERIATAAEVDSGIRTAAEARASTRAADGDTPGDSASADLASAVPDDGRDGHNPDPDESGADHDDTPRDSPTGSDDSDDRSGGN